MNKYEVPILLAQIESAREFADDVARWQLAAATHVGLDPASIWSVTYDVDVLEPWPGMGKRPVGVTLHWSAESPLEPASGHVRHDIHVCDGAVTFESRAAFYGGDYKALVDAAGEPPILPTMGALR